MNAVQEATNLLKILPENDQNFALEFVKKLVLAWDPDYTKVTPAERARLEEADANIKNNEVIDFDEIDWS